MVKRSGPQTGYDRFKYEEDGPWKQNRFGSGSNEVFYIGDQSGADGYRRSLLQGSCTGSLEL